MVSEVSGPNISMYLSLARGDGMGSQGFWDVGLMSWACHPCADKSCSDKQGLSLSISQGGDVADL